MYGPKQRSGAPALDTFMMQRLMEDESFVVSRGLSAEDEAGALDRVHAIRQIVTAYRVSRSPLHRAGLEEALRHLAGVWATHPEYDAAWQVHPQGRRG